MTDTLPPQTVTPERMAQIMAISGYSPGPWMSTYPAQKDDGGVTQQFIIERNGFGAIASAIYSTRVPYYRAAKEQLSDNSDLIAAAPEMHALLHQQAAEKANLVAEITRLTAQLAEAETKLEDAWAHHAGRIASLRIARDMADTRYQAGFEACQKAAAKKAQYVTSVRQQHASPDWRDGFDTACLCAAAEIRALTPDAAKPEGGE